jgi:hypothetical protein
MNRNRLQPLRTIGAAFAVATAIACADLSGPGQTASLGLNARTGDDSAACDISVSGTIWRFSGTGDSASDTLGRLVPLPGARVDFFLIAPLPQDTIPRDSVPRDSVPRDSIPRDSAGGDSTSLWARAIRASVVDSVPGRDTTHRPPARPDGSATSRGNGTYAVTGLCPGIYRVEVREPGTRRTITTWIVVRNDIPFLNFAFPPKR